MLDEPSIGLHPANVDGLLGMMDDLIAHGNSVVLVDHDTRVLKASDWLIEMGPGAGQHGGNVLAQGSLEDVAETSDSLIAGFLTGEEPVLIRKRTPSERMFEQGHIRISTAPLHTVHALDLDIPKGRLVAVTGVSGSGKTTLILESLIPALQASGGGTRLPDHVKAADAPGIRRVSLIDSTPVGINVRSTVATYSGVLDELRKLYAATPEAKEQGCRVSDFPTIPVPCAVQDARAPGRSPWMCSSCRMWRLSARTAAVPDMERKRLRSAPTAYPCRS